MSGRNSSKALSLAAVGLVLGACDSHSEEPTTVDEVVNSCENVAQGEAFASDESYTKFIEAEAAGRLTTEDCRAPVLGAPAPGSTIDRNTPPTFSFTPTQPACSQAFRSGPGRRGACPPARPRGAWARFWRFLSPIGVAEAHCPAVEGPNYLLRLADGQNHTIYSALLSVTSFKPNADTWRKVMAGRGGQAIRVSVSRALFVRGSIMEGPFVSQAPVNLTVAP